MNVRKIKHSAKFILKLEEMDMEDIPTKLRIENTLKKYRKMQKFSFNIQFNVQKIKQLEIYMRYVNKPGSEIPDQMQVLQTKIDNYQRQIIQFQSSMYSLQDELFVQEGKGKALELLLIDKPDESIMHTPKKKEDSIATPVTVKTPTTPILTDD